MKEKQKQKPKIDYKERAKCKDFAQKNKDELKVEVEKFKSKPRLVTIMVGNHDRSEVYVRNKHKVIDEIGAESKTLRYLDNISEEYLLNIIDKLNKNDRINGILVQLPLPAHINVTRIAEAIDPIKDVDGFHYENMGRLFRGEEAIYPCTPVGVIEILDRTKYDVAGKDILVIGRSNILGKPLSQLLIQRDATVLQIHSKSKDIGHYLKTFNPNVIMCCAGVENLIHKEVLNDNTNLEFIIDCAILKNADGKIVGDVDKSDYEYLSNRGIKFTSVPGGVGVLTTTMLAKNLITAYKMQNCLI